MHLKLRIFKDNKLGAAAFYFSGNLINSALPLMLLPILTRYLTPSDYGIVAMFGVVISFYGAFIGMNTGAAVLVRQFQLDPQRQAQFVGACLWILLISTSVFFVIILFVHGQIEEVTQLPQNWVFIAIFISVTQYVIGVRLTLYQAKYEAKKFVLLQFSQSLLNLVLSMYFIIGIHMDWEGRLLAQTITGAILLLLSLTTLYQSKEVTISLFSLPKNDMHDALKFGVPLIPHMVGSIIFATTDKLMIGYFLDISQVGLYTVMAQIGSIIGLISVSFHSVYSPWLMSKLGSRNKQDDCLIVRITYLYFFIMLALAALISILSPWFSLFVGKNFAIDQHVFFLILTAGVFTSMYFMFNNYIFFSNRTSYLSLMTIGCGIFNLGASYFLIKANGLIGAAQATALTQLAFFLLAWFLSHKLHPMPWMKALLPKQWEKN